MKYLQIATLSLLLFNTNIFASSSIEDEDAQPLLTVSDEEHAESDISHSSPASSRKYWLASLPPTLLRAISAAALAYSINLAVRERGDFNHQDLSQLRPSQSLPAYSSFLGWTGFGLGCQCIGFIVDFAKTISPEARSYFLEAFVPYSFPFGVPSFLMSAGNLPINSLGEDLSLYLALSFVSGAFGDIANGVQSALLYNLRPAPPEPTLAEKTDLKIVTEDDTIFIRLGLKGLAFLDEFIKSNRNEFKGGPVRIELTTAQLSHAAYLHQDGYTLEAGSANSERQIWSKELTES